MNAIFISREVNIRKIRKMKKKNDINIMVIGKKLKENKEFIENIKTLNIPVTDGRWLFKYLVVQVIEYITKIQKMKMKDLNIAFMVDSYNELVYFYIKYLINEVRTLKIITSKRWKFEKIERELFENTGSVLIISSNKKKGLKETDIAINFCFDEDRINMFNLNPKMIIINLKKRINIRSKIFAGININYYDISFKNRVIEIYKWLEDFENAEIYESYLYQNAKIEDIMKIIINDKIKIKHLIGNNGKISEREYLNLLDKRHNLS